jgi:hypothetical protein
MIGVRFGLTISISLAIAAVSATILAASSAHAASVKEIFEKYNLLGTFAWDCSRPPSGDNNWYHVHRLLDADHVQRDLMTGPTTRQWVAIIDRVVEAGPNEIEGTGTITGRINGRDLDSKPASGVWHLDRDRLLQWEGTVDGDKVISSGRLVNTGFQLPWSNRCGG